MSSPSTSHTAAPARPAPSTRGDAPVPYTLTAAAVAALDAAVKQ